MKKVELHVHLDGSIRIKTVSELLNLDYDSCAKAMIGKNLGSLDEYLTRFSYPIKIMQDYETLKRVAFELSLDLIKDEVVYAEVRFAPIFHTTTLTLDEVCNKVEKLESQINSCFKSIKDKIEKIIYPTSP